MRKQFIPIAIILAVAIVIGFTACAAPAVKDGPVSKNYYIIERISPELFRVKVLYQDWGHVTSDSLANGLKEISVDYIIKRTDPFSGLSEILVFVEPRE